jgi:chromosome segregation ATPase
LDWVYRNTQVSVRANEALKMYAGPDVSSGEFRTQCADAARQGRDAELRKVAGTFDTKLRTLKERLTREERELSEDQTELSQRKMEELGTHAENFLGIFGGRRSRRLSSSLSKHRLTEQAKADVEESLDAIDDYKNQIAALQAQREAALDEVNQAWGDIANQISDIPVTPYKKDVLLDWFGVAWMPYHVIKIGDSVEELPGYNLK